MSQVHNLFPIDVWLDEETHTYRDSAGKEFMSFSRIVNEFLCPKFDSHNISKYVAANSNTTQEEVLNKWNKQRDEGTRLDNALTLFSQTGQILDSNRDIENIIKHVSEKYSNKYFNKTYEQLVLYNKEFRTAGSSDKTGIISNRRDSGFKKFDFKVFDGGMSYEHKGQKWLNPPLDHLINSKYNKISIQLSFYAWHLEKLTGRKCEGLFIDLIIPIKNDAGKVVSYRNNLIPVNYQKQQIENLLTTFKDKILSIVEPTVIPIEDEF